MQFDTLRAFPYPVLRPDVDDYVDGAIQTLIDFRNSADSQKVVAEVQFALSIPDLKNAIDTGLASYAVVFECRDTYFRHAELSKEPNFKVKFDEGVLRGEVSAKPYIVAVKDISGYTCPYINKEFGNGPFEFKEGSVLAVDRPQQIYIDKDVFKPISSVFTLIADEKLKGYEWHVRLEGDNVQIAVSNDLKRKIDVARNTKSNKAILINSIYFAAVVQCISSLKQKDEEYSTHRWAQVIEQKCHNLGINFDGSPEYLIAQKLMNVPFSLIDTYVFDAEVT